MIHDIADGDSDRINRVMMVKRLMKAMRVM